MPRFIIHHVTKYTYPDPVRDSASIRVQYRRFRVAVIAAPSLLFEEIDHVGQVVFVLEVAQMAAARAMTLTSVVNDSMTTSCL